MNIQDERKKKLKINWLEECPKCKRNHVEVTTIKGSKELLFDGDKVNCWCGQTGEIETNNGEAWVEWDEVVISDKDNHDTYYRSKYPDFWDRLPACNHQAWEHYEVSLHAWLVALKQNKEKLEGCVVVNLESLLLHTQSIRMFNDGDMENHCEEIEEHVCAIEEMLEAARGGNE